MSGHQYENDIAVDIHRRTPSDFRVYTCGYSGSNAMPQPDILITTPTNNHAVELKKRREDVVYIESDDLEQLAACQNSHTIAYLVVKWPHYEPLVIRYWPNMILADEDWNKKSVVEKFAAVAPPEFEAEVTEVGGNLKLVLDRDQWTSAKAGRDDTAVILTALGVPFDESTMVEHGMPHNPYVGIH